MVFNKLIKKKFFILNQRIVDKESAEAKRQKWEKIFTQCAKMSYKWTIGYSYSI